MLNLANQPINCLIAALAAVLGPILLRSVLASKLEANVYIVASVKASNHGAYRPWCRGLLHWLIIVTCPCFITLVKLGMRMWMRMRTVTCVNNPLVWVLLQFFSMCPAIMGTAGALWGRWGGNRDCVEISSGWDGNDICSMVRMGTNFHHRLAMPDTEYGRNLSESK